MSIKGLMRYENRMIIILLFAFGVVFLDRNAYGYLASFIIPELGLSNTQHGMIISSLSFTWALSAIAVGLLADASGKRKNILVICVILFSLCSVLSGMAGTFMVLIMARMLMGISEGGMLPVVQSLVVLESSDERRGLNMGITQNVGSNLIGSFAAPLLLVAVAEAFGWRTSFYLAAIPGLIMAFLVWKFIREPKVHELSSEAATEAPAPKSNIIANLVEIFRHRNTWLCALISCFMVAWMVLGWSFLPVFFTEARGISETNMSWLMSSLGITAAVCAFLVPGLSDKIGRKPVVVVFCLIGVVSPLGALYFSDNLLLVGACLCIGWSASGAFPLFMATIPSETLPVRYLVTSIGAITGIGELIGGVLSPTGAGRAADMYGLDASIWIMLACAVISGLLALGLKETAPVKLKQRAAA